MPELKKKISKKPIQKTPSSKATARELRKWRWTGLVIVSVVIALILIIIGVSYFTSEDAKYLRIAVIKVDDTSVSMGYFIKRARLAGSDPTALLVSLANEQIIKLEAAKYVKEVTPEDVNQQLRKIASGGSDDTSANITESEFREWYRQQLNESRLSDAEYKEITRIAMLSKSLHEYLAEKMPTVAEQVHLHSIQLTTYEDATKTKARWEAGEDFAVLAKEVSTDSSAKENGGDMGWVPRGILPYGFDDTMFNIGTDNISEPVPYTPPSDTSGSSQPQTIYYLLMVSEKANARELDDNALLVLKSKVLDNWLSEESQSHKIEFRGIKGGFDSETNAWINYQIAKGKSQTS